MSEQKQRSQFHAISEAAAELIRASTHIPEGVAVVAYEKGEIESEIDKSLAALGLAVIVLPFETIHAIPGCAPAFYDEAELIVHVVESTLLNATGIDGTALRDFVIAALVGSDLDGLLSEELGEHRIIRADSEDETIREITFKTACGWRG
jgi:hypothetical protein